MAATIEQQTTTWEGAVESLYAEIESWVSGKPGWSVERWARSTGTAEDGGRIDPLLLRTPGGEFFIDPFTDRGPGGRGVVDFYLLSTLESAYLLPVEGGWVRRDPFRRESETRRWDRDEFLRTVDWLIADAEQGG